MASVQTTFKRCYFCQTPVRPQIHANVLELSDDGIMHFLWLAGVLKEFRMFLTRLKGSPKATYVPTCQACFQGSRCTGPSALIHREVTGKRKRQHGKRVERLSEAWLLASCERLAKMREFNPFFEYE